MDSGVLVALIAAGASVLAAIISGWRSLAAERAARDLERIRTDLASEMELRRRRLDADEVLARYREPLAAAAFDLQLRLNNILAGSFLQRYAAAGHDRHEEAVSSSLYRFSQFFGWREALRQGIQFLDFKEPEQSRKVSRLLSGITVAFATDRHGQQLMLWVEAQRAIGELMLQQGDADLTVRGYAWFEDHSSTLAPYLEPLRKAIEDGSASTSSRLVVIRDLLSELVQQLDPEGVRFTDLHDPADDDDTSAPHR